jgi:hypothetical protein
MMGNVAVQHVPGFRAYAEAKAFHDKVEPIRGRGTRPLGRRRDHDMYSIRMGDALSVELMCYSTPVVTFYPNGRMRLMMGGYSSITTRSFMSRVLHISSSSSGPFTKVHIGGQSYIMEPHGEYFFERNAEGKWVALNPKTYTAYRVNRKGANSVRKRYKQFADYLKAFLKLRTSPEEKTFQVGIDEYAQAFGVRRGDGVRLVSMMPRGPRGNPVLGRDAHAEYIPLPGAHDMTERKYSFYIERSDEFVELIRSDDHEKFYKAALWLTCPPLANNIKYESGKYRTIWAPAVTTLFTKVIMCKHAEEAFEAYTTEVGQIPNLKYAQYVAPIRKG